MKKDRYSFKGGSSYIMIPLLGLFLAGLVLFFAKDFFLGTKPPEYHKPEIAEEKPEQPAPKGPDTSREIPGISLTTGADPEIQQGPQKPSTEPAGKEADQVAKVSEAVNGSSSVAARVETDMSSGSGKTENVQSKEVQEAGTQDVSAPSPSLTEDPKYQKDGSWGIQIGMFSRKSDAERLFKEVREKGYNPDITKPGNYYRVRVNGGPTVETALMLKKMLHDEGYDTLVVRSENAPEGSGSVEGFSKYQQDDSWGVQIGMFTSRSDAQRLVSEVENKGFHADITRPGNYYRVRVRAGSDEGTASRIQSLLVQEGYETLIVRSAP